MHALARFLCCECCELWYMLQGICVCEDQYNYFYMRSNAFCCTCTKHGVKVPVRYGDVIAFLRGLMPRIIKCPFNPSNRRYVASGPHNQHVDEYIELITALLQRLIGNSVRINDLIACCHDPTNAKPSCNDGICINQGPNCQAIPPVQISYLGCSCVYDLR